MVGWSFYAVEVEAKASEYRNAGKAYCSQDYKYATPSPYICNELTDRLHECMYAMHFCNGS